MCVTCLLVQLLISDVEHHNLCCLFFSTYWCLPLNRRILQLFTQYCAALLPCCITVPSFNIPPLLWICPVSTLRVWSLEVTGEITLGQFRYAQGTADCSTWLSSLNTAFGSADCTVICLIQSGCWRLKTPWAFFLYFFSSSGHIGGSSKRSRKCQKLRPADGKGKIYLIDANKAGKIRAWMF